MPELGAVIPIDDPKEPQGISVTYQPNFWDDKHNAYYQELVKVYDILFRKLNILIDEKGYFKSSSGW